MIGLVFVLSLLTAVLGIDLDINDASSIYEAQALVLQGLLDYYNGNQSGQSPGTFQQPYFWWESGVAWGTLIDYAYYSKNDTYVDLVKTSLLYQTGPQWNYMTPNQTLVEGNDDQAFWGVATIAAAEKNFSNPQGGYPSWLYLAQGVFNTMAARWDNTTCHGGLRWQIYTWNGGYDYKNNVANGCLFHLAARLARYTGIQLYKDWANRVWDWTTGVEFVQFNAATAGLPAYYRIYDGAYTEQNCTDIRPYEWTYNYGLYISGCAYMYNVTGDSIWLDRVNLIWERATVFFQNKIMYEAACQPGGTCNTDQRCFKGIFSRFLGLTMLLVPNIQDQIMPYIQASAMAAAASCSGGFDGHTCGQNWLDSTYDNVIGLGEQICALDTFNTLLINTMPGPLTQDTGASSRGNISAGLQSASDDIIPRLTLHTKDKVGAGIITGIVVIGLLAGSWSLMF